MSKLGTNSTEIITLASITAQLNSHVADALSAMNTLEERLAAVSVGADKNCEKGEDTEELPEALNELAGIDYRVQRLLARLLEAAQNLRL